MLKDKIVQKESSLTTMAENNFWKRSSFFLKKTKSSSLSSDTTSPHLVSASALYEETKVAVESSSFRDIKRDTTFIDEKSKEKHSPINDLEDFSFSSKHNKKEQLESLTMNEEFRSQDNSCPVCGSYLASKSLQEASSHVNACLDATLIIPENPSQIKENLKTSETFPMMTQGSHFISNDYSLENIKDFPDRNQHSNNGILIPTSSTTSIVQQQSIREADIEEKHQQQSQLHQNKTESSFTYMESNDASVSYTYQSNWKSNNNCPWYKKMPNTPFSVDAFRYGKIPNIEGYFLTHFHADHYGGLTSKFNYSPIFCSPVTGNLVIQQLKVKPQYIVRLELGKRHFINGVYVTLFDANHCPGAVLFLFEVPHNTQINSSIVENNNQFVRILHTGDFRAHKSHLDIPEIQAAPIDILYLDTTYLAPSHTFPSQENVIRTSGELAYRVLVEGALVQHLIGTFKPTKNARKKTMTPCASSAFLLRQWIIKGSASTNNKNTVEKDSSVEEQKSQYPLLQKHKTLILVGSYLIGKERVYLAMAEKANTKIYVDTPKRRILECLEWPELMDRLTADPQEADIHIVSMGHLKEEHILQNLSKLNRRRYTQIITIRPTGWTFKPNKQHNTQQSIEFSLRHLSPTYSNVHFHGRVIPLVQIGIPYSEHSSFLELEMFLKGLKWWPKKIIPTVNLGHAHRRESMKRIMDGWETKQSVNQIK